MQHTLGYACNGRFLFYHQENKKSGLIRLIHQRTEPIYFKKKDIFHSIRTTLTRGRKYEFRMNRINIVSNRTRNVATGVVGGKAGISEQHFQSTCLHCLFVLQYWFYKYYFLLSWYILFRANGKHGAIFRTKCATVLDGRRGSH